MGIAKALNLFQAGGVLLQLVCLVSLAFSAERRIDPEVQANIDSFIQDVFLADNGMSGLTLTIVQDDGELLYTTGYGMANVEKGIEIGNKTQHVMGSMSKTFIALLTVKALHERFPDLGEAVLDTPIKTLLPEANFTLVDRARTEHVTFRDFLSHSICVQDTILMAEPFESIEELVYRSRYNEETGPLRGEQCYSNQLYSVLGELAGMVAGKTFEAALMDFTEELGMPDTTIVKRTDNITEMPNRALPYYYNQAGERLPFEPELIKRAVVYNAAGGVVSTADDMSRYLRFYVSGGSLDGRQIIPAEVMKWMKRTSTSTPYLTFKETKEDDNRYFKYGYGLGLELSIYNQWEFNEHAGNFPPYSGSMSMWPGRKLAIFTGANEFNIGIPPHSEGHRMLFEILEGNVKTHEEVVQLYKKMTSGYDGRVEKAEDYQKRVAEMVAKAGTAEVGGTSIKVGSYGSGRAGDVILSERFNERFNMTLYFIEYGKWYHGWLVQMTPGFYKANWVTEVTQEDQAIGLPLGRHFVSLPGDDSLTIEGLLGQVGVFRFGESLDTLPVIPWDPESC